MWHSWRSHSLDGVTAPSRHHDAVKAIRSGLRLLQVRLRIPLILLVAAIVATQWDTLRNHWDKLTRLRLLDDPAMRTVTNDVEYFCPMDPGVMSDWPGKCGVCHMALVTRKKGDATMLRNGVIARMQLTPYRIQLAGILTTPIGFRPLFRTHETVGVVEHVDQHKIVRCEVPVRRAPWLTVGGPAELRFTNLPGIEPCAGTVARIERRAVDGFETLQLEVAMAGDNEALRPGMSADVAFRIPAADLEPFRSQLADPPVRRPEEPTQIYACLDHPDSIGLTTGNCPEDHIPRVFRVLDERQRIRWWCPMHPSVTAEQPGRVCDACGGMVLRPRILTYRPPGQVLAVPESAVVDTGTRTVVFVESMPGMFDGVEVVLGPRCGDDYPVVRGLEVGQKVVVTGAFLLDAETRLNPSLASGYFGAARRQAEESTGSPENVAKSTPAAPVEANLPALASLLPADQEQAKRQRICPVTRKPLGSMGPPIRVEVNGRVVFICCSGCEDRLRGKLARDLSAPTNAETKAP